MLREFRDGSETAAAVLYGRYAERLRQLARANLSPLLARRIDADDIVQSAFLCFFKAVRQGAYDLPSGEDFWSLLMVIALNRIRLQKAHHGAAKRNVGATKELATTGSSLQVLRQRDDERGAFLRLIIREALERLPLHHQQMIQLRMEGCQVAEIAERLQRSKRSVERVLQDAKQQLRALLEEEVLNED